jgi:hypothetical protein
MARALIAVTLRKVEMDLAPAKLSTSDREKLC